MRVFVTGASGWIGSAVVTDLIDAGHEVVGLARSDASAAAVEDAGAEVVRGSLDDLDILRAARGRRGRRHPHRLHPRLLPDGGCGGHRPRRHRGLRRGARGLRSPARRHHRDGRPAARPTGRPRTTATTRSTPGHPRRDNEPWLWRSPSAACASSIVRPRAVRARRRAITASSPAWSRSPASGRLRLRRRRRQPLGGGAPPGCRAALSPARSSRRRPARCSTPSATRACRRATSPRSIARHLSLPLVSVDPDRRRRPLRLARRLLLLGRAGLQRAHPRAAGLGADAIRG